MVVVLASDVAASAVVVGGVRSLHAYYQAYMLQCAWEAVELVVVLVLAWEGLVAYMWDDSLVVAVVAVLDDSLAQASVGWTIDW